MKTLITEFISLDGVVQAPGGASEDTDGGFSHGGWSMKYFDPVVMGGTYAELAKHSDALLQGRRTYHASARAWPNRSGDPFSDWINRVQKYVVSNTLTEKDITWNPTTIIRGGDLVKTVSDLRAQPGGYIYVYGSATMVRSLLAADLVDELLLTIEPIILGGGKTIFAENGKAIPFTLESTAKASSGAQVCRYVRAMTKKYIAKQSITIHAPAFKVWQALITPDIIKQYLFGAEVITDWREGSSIVFRGTWEGKPYEDKGKVLKVEPEKLLATTYWSAFSGLPDSPENYQRVTYELLNQGRKTVLTVTQDDILSEEGQSQADKNWQVTLSTLKTLVEK